MSLGDARRALQWNLVMEALAAAGADADTVKLVEFARSASDVVHGMMQMVVGGADVEQAKNYVKVEVVGLVAPFDRAYVELVRPGGKTSHELRELLHRRLLHVRSCMHSEHIKLDVFRDGIVQGIDEDLAVAEPGPAGSSPRDGVPPA